MLIRKTFKFEGAHVVRNCSTPKCKYSVHGHSYRVEFLLQASALDHGHMVVDFSIVKELLNKLVDAFDHTIVLWDQDTHSYLTAMKEHSVRWIQLPVSPSAEQLSRVFFILADERIRRHAFNNGESGDLSMFAVIVHETETGYAQCFEDDARNPRMGIIDPKSIVFSAELRGC